MVLIGGTEIGEVQLIGGYYCCEKGIFGDGGMGYSGRHVKTLLITFIF